MPLLEVYTNLARAQIPADFLAKLSKKCEELSGKEEKLCIAHVLPDQLMTFAGSAEPCAKIQFRNIGSIRGEPGRKLASNLTAFIHSELGIAEDRFFILYHELSTDEVAYMGLTITDLKVKLGIK